MPVKVDLKQVLSVFDEAVKYAEFLKGESILDILLQDVAKKQNAWTKDLWSQALS